PVFPTRQTAGETTPAPEELRCAAARPRPLGERGAKAKKPAGRHGLPCHNQGLPLLALTTARARGFEIDGQHVETQVQFIADFLADHRSDFESGKGTGGQVATAAQALWALETGNWKPDEDTAAVAGYLLGF